jgi:trans-2,3-dihydro-3-hydroxyanthranilate isomerase
MTSTVRFFLVDVFADRPLTGNPLALVPDAEGLTLAQLRALAREFNQSETTFLFRTDEEGVDWRLRSFTPAGVEVDGAGHNAVGAWVWLAEQGLTGDEAVAMRRQRIGAEVLAVEVRRSPGQPPSVVMDQGVPVFGAVIARDERLARALGLTLGDLAADRAAQVVSTGVSHLLVPLVDREGADAVVVDHDELKALLADAGAEGCYVYTTAGPAEGLGPIAGDRAPAAAYTRFFNPTVGIAEDPATGTAAGPLAVALLRSGSGPASGSVTIEQGHRLGRPSRIRVDVDRDRVRLHGSGLVVGHGEVRLT